MTTPFDSDGGVDTRALSKNIARWLAAGVGGVVALGTNGESAFLDDAESDLVIDTARTALPRDRVLIAGSGRESTRATIDASQRAARLGADAVLVRTPSFFKARMTQDVFLRHYLAVADGSPVPVLLYNFPALTGVSLTAETVARLAQHPNIAGIKESSSDVAQIAAFVDATPAEFTVLAGAAPALYAALCIGAKGGILAAACVVPELCVRLFELTRAGRHEEARAMQARLSPLARLVTAVHGVPGLKAAMDAAGYVGGAPRGPLTPASADAVAQIRAELSRTMEVA